MSLLVWLPLNGDLRNNGLAGGITVTNSGATVNAAGKIGKCYEFPKTADGKLTYPRVTSGNVAEFSVAGWINLNSGYGTNNGFHLINWGLSYGRICFSKDGYAVRVLMTDGDSGKTIGYASVMTASQVSAGIWYHVAVCFDNGDLRIYINGELDNQVTTMISTVKVTAASVIIGLFGSEYGSGKLNDYRFYDHALSDREVKELAKGMVAHWKLDDLIGNENLIRNSNAAEFNGTYVSGTTYHWSKWNQATDHSIELINGKYWFHCKSPASTTYGGFNQDHTLNGDVYRIKPNTTYTISATWFASTECNCCYWFHWMSSEGGANLSQTTKNFTVTTSPKRISATVTSYNHADYTVNRFRLMIGPRATTEGVDIYFTDVKFEEGDTATQWLPSKYDDIYAGWEFNVAHDSSGYCHDGTLSSTPPTFDSDSARYSGCMKFVASSQNSIDCGVDTWLPTDEISVSWWGYMDTWGTTRPISCTESGGWNFEQGDGGGWRFPVNKKGSGYIYATPVKKWADYTSGWHFFVGTFDGYVSRIYADGELDSTSTNGSPEVKAAIAYNQNAKLFLGCEASGAYPSSPYFTGKLSDIRIYATALSADDIKELYTTSASIDDRHNVYARELVEK